MPSFYGVYLAENEQGIILIYIPQRNATLGEVQSQVQLNVHAIKVRNAAMKLFYFFYIQKIK
jgi:hypothetical protein